MFFLQYHHAKEAVRGLSPEAAELRYAGRGQEALVRRMRVMNHDLRTSIYHKNPYISYEPKQAHTIIG